MKVPTPGFIVQLDAWLHEWVIRGSRVLQTHLHCNRDHLVALACAVGMLELAVSTAISLAATALKPTCTGAVIDLMILPVQLVVMACLADLLDTRWTMAKEFEADPVAAATRPNTFFGKSMTWVREFRQDGTLWLCYYSAPIALYFGILKSEPLSGADHQFVHAFGVFVASIIALHLIDSDHVSPDKRTSTADVNAPETP